MTNLRPMQAAVWTTACLQLILSDEMTIFAWIFAGAPGSKHISLLWGDYLEHFSCIFSLIQSICVFSNSLTMPFEHRHITH